MARCRSFWGMNLMVTSTPCFLKMPAFSARERGAKPVHPLMATVTLGRSWARTAATGVRARTPATSEVSARISLPPKRFVGTKTAPVRIGRGGAPRILHAALRASLDCSRTRRARDGSGPVVGGGGALQLRHPLALNRRPPGGAQDEGVP